MTLNELYIRLGQIHDEQCDYTGEGLCGCELALLLSEITAEIIKVALPNNVLQLTGEQSTPATENIAGRTLRQKRGNNDAQ